MKRNCLRIITIIMSIRRLLECLMYMEIVGALCCFVDLKEFPWCVPIKCRAVISFTFLAMRSLELFGEIFTSFSTFQMEMWSFRPTYLTQYPKHFVFRIFIKCCMYHNVCMSFSLCVFLSFFLWIAMRWPTFRFYSLQCIRFNIQLINIPKLHTQQMKYWEIFCLCFSFTLGRMVECANVIFGGFLKNDSEFVWIHLL